MTRFARTLTVLLVLMMTLTAPLLARMDVPPRSMTTKTVSTTPTAMLDLDAIDPVALLLEDAQKAEEPGPLRFALPADVSITPPPVRDWERLPDGWLWKLEVRAPGATDLNFGFGRYLLPKGATLHLVSLEEDYYQGAYTEADNQDHGQLWTPVIPGSRALIEVFVPADAEFVPELELVRIGRGYRDLFKREPGFFQGILKQGSCNIDVICPLGDNWRNQIRAVAVYGTNGSTFCTGTLINNLGQDCRPFFLTANHCGITSSNAASVVAYWNYESPTCGALSGGTLNQSTSGATFRASDYQNDMTLIEFNSTPNESYNVYYSGWDARTSTAPQGSIGIHHPNTDEKAISENTDALTTMNSCIGTGGVSTHWRVNNWEQGTTEPGSSGSGLWDPATGLLVGYLSGGAASCTNYDYDCYGKMSVGWSRGLSTWLDPSSTGTRYVTGMDCDGGCTPTEDPEVSCSDGQDNDCDGLTDGADPDCQSGGNELQNHVPVTGLSATTGNSLNYTMDVPAGATNLVFTTSGSDPDADLYVKFGSPPTRSNYDCRSWSSSSNETCNMGTAQGGTYYVMVYAYSSFTGLTLRGDYDEGGSCGDVENYSNLSGSTGTELRYTFDVAACASTATFEISGGSGDADLYVRFGNPPTTSTWDCRPYEWGNDEICTFSPPSIGTYHVMVRAYSSFSGVLLEMSYE